MTELIETPFGMWSQVGPWKHALDRVHIGASWRIRLNRPNAMRLYVKLLWPLVITVIVDATILTVVDFVTSGTKR